MRESVIEIRPVSKEMGILIEQLKDAVIARSETLIRKGFTRVDLENDPLLQLLLKDLKNIYADAMTPVLIYKEKK